MSPLRMTLRHVEAFNTVMRCGTMTEAARVLHTSQPQVSRLVAQLEAIAQFRLFDRQGSRLRPTLDAMRFHQEVRKVFDGLHSLESAAAHIRGFGAQRLNVAAMPRLASGLMARAVAAFNADYPQVLVAIRSGDARAVHGWVHAGLCDAGLAMLYDGEADAPGLRVDVVQRVNFVAVLPPGHALGRQAVVHARDLDGQPLVAGISGGSLRAHCDRILGEAGASVRVVAEANLGASICALVAAGLGVGLINPLAAREELRQMDLQVRPFLPELPLAVALLFPQQPQQHRLVESFARLAKAALQRELEELLGAQPA